MGLLVGRHLNAVLDRPQETVGFVRSSTTSALDPAAFGEAVKGGKRARLAQIGLAAAGNQLLGLDEEFDLADAAAPELDVVALDGDLLEAAVRMDLALHRVDVGDGGEVEILAPDERAQFAQEALAAARCRRRPGAP